MKAVSITWQTCLGRIFPPKDPLGPQGINCFSVIGDDGKEYRIVNFYVEDLRLLLDKLGLTYPVQCKVLGSKTAIVHDPRIGERWYAKRYCECCCPIELLPSNQRDIHERDIARGRRKEGKLSCGSGYHSFDMSIKAQIE